MNSCIITTAGLGVPLSIGLSTVLFDVWIYFILLRTDRPVIINFLTTYSHVRTYAYCCLTNQSIICFMSNVLCKKTIDLLKRETTPPLPWRWPPVSPDPNPWFLFLRNHMSLQRNCAARKFGVRPNTNLRTSEKRAGRMQVNDFAAGRRPMPTPRIRIARVDPYI